MKKILLLGSTGFIGSNVILSLRERYNVCAPPRAELNLLDANAVRRYLERERFDVVVNFSTPTTQNPIDKPEELLECSLRIFSTLEFCSGLYGRMLYIGSGAEYGKHRAIRHIREDGFGQELPQDSYGLSRYIASKLAEKSNNIYNLRLFGCYGIGDPPYKLVPHVINCIRENKPIELKQNTLFDFLYVMDIVPVLIHFIENEPKHRAYNLCSGEPILTGDMVFEVKRQMKSDIPIAFKQDGFGLEYTGNNDLLRSEIQNWKPCSISEGIKEIIDYENRKI